MSVRASVVVVALLATALFTVVAPPAVSGGWATVELSSTPDGVRAGEPWVVDLKILQHGRTPLENVRPAVILHGSEDGVETRFVARPTGTAGVYRAQVLFPTAGKWDYSVDNGFAQVSTYPAVRIAERAPAPAVGSAAGGADAAPGPRWIVIAGALAIGLLAAGLTLAVLRRRRPGRVSTGVPAAPPTS
jgi:hypothetical protein